MSIPKATTLTVQGMTCGSCVRNVTMALEDLEGVDRIDVRFREGLVVVQHDDGSAPVERLIDVLREAGYESQRKP